MSHTATSAQRQASEATRLAMIAIFGCGDPECFKCYPSTTSVHNFDRNHEHCTDRTGINYVSCMSLAHCPSICDCPINACTQAHEGHETSASSTDR